MKCGRCGEPMERGVVEVHGTPFGFSLFGPSMQDLYWYDAGQRKKSRRRIIDSGTSKPAHGCKKCGIVTIDTTAESSVATKGSRLRRFKRQTESP